MMAFRSLLNYIDQLTASVAKTDIFTMGYSRGKLANFGRGKLAHLISVNTIFQKSIFYSIFRLYFSYFITQTKDFAAKTNLWS